MGNNESIIRKYINKVKDFLNGIIKKIKLLVSPIGQIIGWLLLIILIVILFSVIGKVATRAIGRLVGINWNYSTFDKDLEVIKQLNVSGYESSIDAENFQNFKSFEYAVLMDVADYLKNTKQEMFDIVENEKSYIFERNLIKNAKPDEYNAKIAELSKKYANVGGGSDPSSVPLMNVNFSTNQSKLSDGALQTLINSSSDARNVTVTGITESGSIKGGTNRVNGPFLAFEFKDGTNNDSTGSGSGVISASVDESKLTGMSKTIWSKYSKEIIYSAEKYGLDPYLIMAVICKESGGKLNCQTWNSSHTNYAFGLLQTYGAERSATHKATDLEGNEFILDASDDAMRDNAQRQIEVGVSYIRPHIITFNWNVHDGVGGYNKGDTGYRRNPGGFYNYWFGKYRSC